MSGQPGPTSYAGYERGQGWVIFAAALLLTMTLNVIDGIAAISKAHFYVGNAHTTSLATSRRGDGPF